MLDGAAFQTSFDACILYEKLLRLEITYTSYF